MTSDWVVGSPIAWTGEWQGRAYEDKGIILADRPGASARVQPFQPACWSGRSAGELPHRDRAFVRRRSAATRVSLRQDNNLTEEACERAERNWSMMLAGLKHFVEHNRPTIDTEPD